MGNLTFLVFLFPKKTFLKRRSKMDINFVAGQLFIREVAKKSGDINNIHIIAGLLHSNKSYDLGLKGENQYVFMGNNYDKSLKLVLYKHDPIDLTEEARGNSIGGILKSTIWNKFNLQNKMEI